jgi:glycosyltransferase involved in cell wall biosynthesis
MKVAFVLPRDFGAAIGGYAVAYRYASMLAARGHDVRVLHVTNLGEVKGPVPTARQLVRLARGRHEPAPAPISWYPLDPRVRSEQVGILTAGLLQGLDAVVVTAWDTAERVGELAPKLGSTHIAYLIQHYEIWSGPQERVDATWQLPITKVVIAGWLLENARRLGAVPVVHVPNAIEPAEFSLRTPPEDRDPAHVAMLWHELPFKRSADGLAALTLARESDPRITATFFSVFDPPADLPDWVTFVHRADVAQLGEIYNRAAVFISPSDSEGWPLPPAEAMACGAALLSTDIPGVRDYARPGDSAVLVPVGDPPAMAAALLELIGDPAARASLARRGAAVIDGEFTWQRSVELFERTLLERPPG